MTSAPAADAICNANLKVGRVSAKSEREQQRNEHGDAAGADNEDGIAGLDRVRAVERVVSCHCSTAGEGVKRRRILRGC
jgi:hypothetical protein